MAAEHPLYDSHCHLDFAAFDADRDAMFARAHAAGINHFMIPGVEAHSWQALGQLCDQLQQQGINANFALGLHPYFIGQHQQQHITQLRDRIEYLIAKQHHCFKAVGEIGLDVTCEQFSWQQELLEQQLTIAKDYQLPVILHHRKSLDLLLKQVRKRGLSKGVVHAFSGSYEQAKAWVDQGFYLGVGGTITYSRAQKTRKAIAAMPLTSLVLETDSPDMPLAGHQGQRNEPAKLPLVADTLAELKSLAASDVIEQCTHNTQQLFNG